jgi:Na+-transporting NADH:ubiquinone oxidoreductase subunit C
MKDKFYTIGYAAVLGCVCALLLSAAGVVTRPYRKANERAEEIRNILRVLDIEVPAGASSQELIGLFEKSVKIEERGELTLYRYESDGELQAMAVPFSGQGVWGPVHGLLSLEPDLRTIRGISFYRQEETPGLGGEIGAAWFQRQFEGKKIASGGEAGMRVTAPGEAKGEREVDGITGATMTSSKVEGMLNETIRQILEAKR